MCYIGDASTTKMIDNYCSNTFLMSEHLMMENAGIAATKRIKKIIKNSKKNYRSIVIFCGKGKNGGDGFVIARRLLEQGYDVEIVLLAHIDELDGCVIDNYDSVECYETDIIQIYDTCDDIEYNLDNILRSDVLIVDCIFGVGLNRNIKGHYCEIVDYINENKYLGYDIVSIDIPSGLNATTGEVMGVSIVADYTITFDTYKKAFLNYNNEDIVGKVYVEKISLPKEILESVETIGKFTDMEFIKRKKIDKKNSINKGNNGRVCIFAGSEGFYGAPIITGRACVKSGSGLVTIICTKEVEKIVSSNVVEEMTCKYDDVERLERLIKSADSFAFGPGMGNSSSTKERLEKLMNITDKPIVIDADGLNVFEEKFIRENSNIILTPHLGEFSRMIGVSIEEINKDRIKYASEYAKRLGVVLVLKGKHTIITNGYKVLVNPTGNEGMANGGTGDCLTGIISSLCGQGYDIFSAAAIGTYIHGLSGDLVFKKKYTVNASDIIKKIPKVMKMLYN